MSANESVTFVMAQRLKALRNQKGLSHEALRKALMEKYEVNISVDSLKNYEVATPHHQKAYKNLGMRVEYLQILADFYGVSTDYILGRTDEVAQKPAAVDELGFSPKVIQWLLTFKTSSQPIEGTDYIPYEGLLQIANYLFENTHFQNLVTSLCELIDGIEAEKIYYSIPWERDLSERIQKIANSGEYRSPVSDFLLAQDTLCDDKRIFMPGNHMFGINVTDILNNDVNSAISRLVDSLRRRQE